MKQKITKYIEGVSYFIVMRIIVFVVTIIGFIAASIGFIVSALLTAISYITTMSLKWLMKRI